MKIVGFTGAKYSGKDTAAKALMSAVWLGMEWQRTAFADPLREMLYALNPIVMVLTQTEEKGALGGCATRDGVTVVRWAEAWDTVGYDTMKTWPEVRRLMQVFGTEVMREQFGADVWVDLTMRKIDASPQSNWAISDVRFDNEAQAIRGRGGRIIEVVWTGEDTRDTHGDGSMEFLGQIRRAVLAFLA